MGILDPQYLEPGTATGSMPVPGVTPQAASPLAGATPSLRTTLIGPNPALPAGAAGAPVAGAPLDFTPPAGASSYYVVAAAQYGAASGELVLAGLQGTLAGPATPGKTITLTPLWAPTTAAAVAAGAAQHSVTVVWQ